MRIINQQIPQSVWVRASVVASFWAAFEIVVGSFLHNLRIPMSGTFLSFVSVVLVVAFSVRWNQSGLIWRAGLICAILKSISPSAVILGPMIGIFSEAFLLQLFIWLLGRNIAGYMIGGAFAVFSAFLHKAVSLLILYGFNLVELLESLYKYSVKQIGLSNFPASDLIVLLISIYLILGLLAGLLGYIIGKIPAEDSDNQLINKQITSEAKSFFNNKGETRYSLFLLFFNLFAILGLLFILSETSIWISYPLILAYLIFVIFRYHNSIRHLKKPALWIQFILITIVASVLLGTIKGESVWNMDGLAIGLDMIIRAVIVVLGFSAIGNELRNPVIRAISSRNGMSVLYQSINLSFSALPQVVQSLPERRTFFRNPLRVLSSIIAQSDIVLQNLERSIEDRNPVVIVCGDKQEGKTTYLGRLAEACRSAGINPAGILAPGVHSEGVRIGFDLLDIQSNKVYILCREQKGKAEHYTRFKFDELAMEEGRRILSFENLGDSNVVFVDEVGPIELNNGGWSSSIRELLKHRGVVQVWSVRRHLVEQVASAWQVGEVTIVDIAEDSLDDAVSLIQKLAPTNQGYQHH
ncbi:MAG: hypothetical protein IPH88_06030 [Bacteroidales bacterium]|nr:hypothetical protein [Bacteroidales bacterium]